MYIAHSTKELSNLACLVAVVYNQSTVDIRRTLSAKITLIVLFFNHPKIVFVLKVISILQV